MDQVWLFLTCVHFCLFHAHRDPRGFLCARHNREEDEEQHEETNKGGNPQVHEEAYKGAYSQDHKEACHEETYKGANPKVLGRRLPTHSFPMTSPQMVWGTDTGQSGTS